MSPLRLMAKWRPLVALVAGAALLGASLGVMPSREWLAWAGARLTAERFPCESGRCGCASARECWTVCLCQSLDQKLAWAEREGVEIPDFVDVQLVSSSSSSEPACALCATAERPAEERGPSPLPELGPLGCKGVSLLAATGVVLALPAGCVLDAPMETGAERFWVPPSRRPSGRTLETRSPPPRA